MMILSIGTPRARWLALVGGAIVAVGLGALPGARAGGGPACGDGVIELDEQCDDGNAVGGDGCAANCTVESVRSFTLDPGLSTMTIQTESFPITVRLSGALDVTSGRARPSDPTGQIPLVTRVAGFRFEPAKVIGLVCLCLRGVQVPAFGTGNAGQGTIGCGTSGLNGIDYATLVDGGAPTTTYSGHGGPGSLLMRENIAVALLEDAGTCDVSGHHCVPAYGPDCLPCTDDDPDQGTATLLDLTTGSASATIVDPNGDAGAVIGPTAVCFGSPCIAQVGGAPLNCGSFAAAGPLYGGVLAAAYPTLAQPMVGDSVMTIRFVNAAQAPPTPTPTPTVQRSVTVTATATATAAVPEAPASLVLRRAKLRAAPGHAGGWIKLDGDIDTNAPFGGFAADVAAAGLDIDVSTSGGDAVALGWSASQCSIRGTERGPIIRCSAANAVARRVVILHPTDTPNVLGMRLVAHRLALTPPLSTDPVHASVTSASYRRSDDIDGCTVHGSRGRLKSCRETGVVP